MPKLPTSNSTGTNVQPLNQDVINLTSSQALEAISNTNSQAYTPPHFLRKKTDNYQSFLKKIFLQQLVRNPGKQPCFTQETLHVRQNKEALLA